MQRRWIRPTQRRQALYELPSATPPGGWCRRARASSASTRLVVVLARLGLNEAAATLNGTLTTATEAIAFVEEITDVVTRVREALGDATFADATRRGAAIASHEANGYAPGQIRQRLRPSASPTFRRTQRD